MHWIRATGVYCEDDTVLMRRHVKRVHQHVLTPSLGYVLMVQYDTGTSPLVRSIPMNAY